MIQRDQATAKDELSFNFNKGIADQIKITYHLEVLLFGKNGKLKKRRIVHNTVTASGKNGIADQLLAAPTIAKPAWMAVGTGTPTATLLGAEIARVAFSTKTRSTNVVTMSADFPAGTGTGAITEAGTFNVVTANTVDMYMSASFAVINKGALDSVTLNWTLTIN